MIPLAEVNQGHSVRSSVFLCTFYRLQLVLGFGFVPYR